MMAVHTNCTCPLCCPDKWAINRAVFENIKMQFSATGIPQQNTTQDNLLAAIVAKLDRIEAILMAHSPVNPRVDDK